MHRRSRRKWLCSFFFFLLVSAGAATGTLAFDSLTDILLEKGVLEKEDWKRIQAYEEKKEKQAQEDLKKEFPVKVGWGKQGFTLETLDGKWKTALQWRFQGRFSYPDRGDEDTVKEFADNPESTFELRRVRMKIGGHGYEPWIKYYIEVDLQSTANSGSSPGSTRVIDWRIDLAKYKWATLRVGQWKINFNRERVDSSGKQQFVERSIVNNVFTIDRQMGVMLMGHLAPGTFADSRYYAGVWNGSGRGEANDDDNMMWMGRVQWNFLGRDLPFSQSDVEYHEHPAGSIAFGAYTNIGKCTKWSSSGCGHLEGFTNDSDAVDGQFKTEGLVEEFAFKWRGLSVQHEYHWKQIKDAGKPVTASSTFVLPSKTHMMGSYSQIGYFPHYLIPAIPKPLEVAFRYAFVDPDVGKANDTEQEFTAGLNWFFAGHRNKLTLDGSWLTLATSTEPQDLNEQRIRLQWDVSF